MRFRGRSGAMLTRAPLRDTFIVPLQLGQLRIHFLWVKFVPLYPPTFGVVILLCWRQLLFFSRGRFENKLRKIEKNIGTQL